MVYRAYRAERLSPNATCNIVQAILFGCRRFACRHMASRTRVLAIFRSTLMECFESHGLGSEKQRCICKDGNYGTILAMVLQLSLSFSLRLTPPDLMYALLVSLLALQAS